MCTRDPVCQPTPPESRPDNDDDDAERHRRWTLTSRCLEYDNRGIDTLVQANPITRHADK